MRAPAFWRSARAPARPSCAPSAALYGAVAAWRMGRAGERAALPVICVGNFTVGGAGKTPTALRLAALLAAHGRAPRLPHPRLRRLARRARPGRPRAAPRRGGRRRAAAARPRRPDDRRPRPAGGRAARRRDRRRRDRHGRRARRTRRSPRIWPSPSSTARRGSATACRFPAGPLRAPLAAQWPRVDARDPGRRGRGRRGGGARGGAAGQARAARRGSRPDRRAAGLRGRRVLAFAGIGRPAKFFETLEGVRRARRAPARLSRPPPLHGGRGERARGGGASPRG